MQIHVVSQGESLWQIARMYHTDLNQVIYVNQLENPDVLVIGQSLIIPESNLEYVVQPGENLWQIAEKVGVTVQELQQSIILPTLMSSLPENY